MFGSLKEKLKNWVQKAKTSPEPKEKEPKRITVKAPKKAEDRKLEKQIKKSKKKAEKLKRKEKAEEKKQEKELKKEPEKKEEIQEEPEQAKKEIEKKEEIQEEPSEIEEPPQKKKSFFSKFKKTLSNEKFDELFEELEFILLQNNVAIQVVEKIKLSLEEKIVGENLSNINLEQSLKESIASILINPPDFIKEIKNSLKTKQPYTIIFTGINGSGKTTTIAKIAHLLKKQKLSTCLAAADTFRAASIEQLQEHADKLNVPLIKKDYNTDPASVGFDAIQYAKKHQIDVVLIDTAGRMQNKDSLMQEIEKINRVNNPNMKIFVGESITGNDAIEQAKVFNQTIDLTGIILSKSDVDEKGGTAISVSYITKKPILFLGTGQTYDDLEVFDKDKLVNQLGL